LQQKLAINVNETTHTPTFPSAAFKRLNDKTEKKCICMRQNPMQEEGRLKKLLTDWLYTLAPAPTTS
jgi:hypothetical protein